MSTRLQNAIELKHRLANWGSQSELPQSAERDDPKISMREAYDLYMVLTEIQHSAIGLLEDEMDMAVLALQGISQDGLTDFWKDTTHNYLERHFAHGLTWGWMDRPPAGLPMIARRIRQSEENEMKRRSDPK